MCPSAHRADTLPLCHGEVCRALGRFVRWLAAAFAIRIFTKREASLPAAMLSHK